jgi:mannose-6-phosphate isomerase-like protein (cupin superfamily)
MSRLLAAVAVLGTAVVATPLSAAQTPTNDALYISDAQLQAVMAKIPPVKDAGKPGSFSLRQFSASTYSMSFIRLSDPDTPHVHGAWSEVYVMRAGEGVLETGGTVTGVTGNDSATHKSMFVDSQGNALPSDSGSAAPRKTDPGDQAGTGIDGGKRQEVKAGDVILIPAGVPHRWLKVDEPVVYLDIKFPKAQ